MATLYPQELNPDGEVKSPSQTDGSNDLVLDIENASVPRWSIVFLVIDYTATGSFSVDVGTDISAVDRDTKVEVQTFTVNGSDGDWAIIAITQQEYRQFLLNGKLGVIEFSGSLDHETIAIVGR